MSKRINTVVALVGMAGLFSGCNIQQPSAGCQVQDATDVAWQAGYTLVNAADASKSCGKLKGEAIGVFKYLDPVSGKSRLAIRPEGAASLVSYVDGDKEVLRVTNPESATSLSATLADQPDSTGLCAATSFPESRVEAAAVPAKSLPAETAVYQFGTVQVYSAPDAPGTQLKGTFTYSDGAGCTAEYKMVALWPQTGCDIDAFNAPTPANAADRCGEGSGLNPDFDAACIEANDGEHYCVPAKDVPSFRTTTR